MKRAFTLVEILIVVAILGILAAIALPTLRGHIIEAREAAAKDNLRILRNAIELYAAQHNDVPPGYPDNDPTNDPHWFLFIMQLLNGKYFRTMPQNPFNDLRTAKVLNNSEAFPEEPTGTHGWIYQPATKTIRLNYPGNDKDGIRYYDY